MHSGDGGGHLRQRTEASPLELIAIVQHEHVVHPTLPLPHQPGSPSQEWSAGAEQLFASAETLRCSLQFALDMTRKLAVDSRLKLPGDSAPEQVGTNIWRRLAPAVAPFGAELRRSHSGQLRQLSFER